MLLAAAYQPERLAMAIHEVGEVRWFVALVLSFNLIDFCGLKRQGGTLLPPNGMIVHYRLYTHLHSWGKSGGRERGEGICTLRIECLAQEHNVINRLAPELEPPD